MAEISSFLLLHIVCCIPLLIYIVIVKQTKKLDSLKLTAKQVSILNVDLQITFTNYIANISGR